PGLTPPPDVFAFLLSPLTPSHPATQRLAAANALTRLKLPSSQRLDLTDPIKSASPLEFDRLLTAFDPGGDDTLGLKLLSSLKESRALPALRPDALQRHLAKFSDTINQQSTP